MEREPSILIAVGTKGVGKTFRTIQEIKNYTKTTATKKGRKVLIFDVNAPMEQSYNAYKTVSVEDLSRLKKIEVRRIIALNKDRTAMTLNQKLETCYKILSTYIKGCLVLEDINNYAIGAKSQEFIGAITTNRHKDLDIIIHLQSLSALDPRLWQNTTIIRFHYQADNIDRYRNRIPNYELMKLAQLIVNRQYFIGNKRFFVYVLNLDNKIKGASLPAFTLACAEYLNINKTILRDIMSQGLNKADAVQEFVRQKMHYITFEDQPAQAPTKPVMEITYKKKLVKKKAA